MSIRQSRTGEIRVDKINLHTAFGTRIDILPFLVSISIVESVYNKTIRGEINLEDGIGLSETAPIIGSERLEISFHNPASDTIYNTRFVVVELKNRAPMPGSKKGMTYTLSFISEESLKSARSRISKKYRGTIPEIVERIYDEYLKTQKRRQEDIGDEEVNEGFLDRLNRLSNKLNVPYDASGTHEIVIPNWNPLDAIDILSRRAVSRQARAVNFVFFETLHNFNFVSIDSLLREPPRRSYLYMEKNLAQNSVERESTFINNFTIHKSFQNPLAALQQGIYSGTLITYDIVRKKIEKTTYNYKNEFAKRQHLGEYPLIQEQNALNPHRYASSTIFMYPKHKGLHTALDNSNFSESWMLQGNSHRHEITAISATVNIPGDTGISAGDIVFFDLHMFKEGNERTPNPYLNGNYMILNLTHTFTRETYNINMDIVSDTFNSSIEQPGELGGENEIGSGPDQGDE